MVAHATPRSHLLRGGLDALPPRGPAWIFSGSFRSSRCSRICLFVFKKKMDWSDQELNSGPYELSMRVGRAFSHFSHIAANRTIYRALVGYH